MHSLIISRVSLVSLERPAIPVKMVNLVCKDPLAYLVQVDLAVNVVSLVNADLSVPQALLVNVVLSA